MQSIEARSIAPGAAQRLMVRETVVTNECVQADVPGRALHKGESQ
ncbi:hypothetical protein AWB81_05700 [Caballeronia arationis]|jgi:hypothetical protein|uniref:Uncharacterized protein n=1 Tax=Caballeronia arationis TaxID=1777142 RepID=A0A7Z7N4C0_9BURK|nr:hypothetical protein AWB81_05700 [Caballeronia arationis]SOE81909.1 hypothetical protein SAMN05446927_5206 [Caballeronia arationis]